MKVFAVVFVWPAFVAVHQPNAMTNAGAPPRPPIYMAARSAPFLCHGSEMISTAEIKLGRTNSGPIHVREFLKRFRSAEEARMAMISSTPGTMPRRVVCLTVHPNESGVVSWAGRLQYS
jgi:hypothetical protein